MSFLLWVGISILGAAGWMVLALHRGETVSAAWLVLAAVGTYLVGVPVLQPVPGPAGCSGSTTGGPRRPSGTTTAATSSPPQRWVLFGHHFAAIAGAGPLVGPVLAAQFGYLPGTIWIVFGVVLGGAVQDFIILFASMRRDGKSLGQMAREEIGPITGMLAMIAVLVDHGHPARGAGPGGGQRPAGQPVGACSPSPARFPSRCSWDSG